MTQNAPSKITLHATCVHVAGKAVLILGKSGSGKSALALQLIALGAELVSDDQTILNRQGDGVVASPPAAIAGMIEARNMGILQVPHADDVPIELVVNMETDETERLPPNREFELLGVSLPCLYHVRAPHFASTILLYLKGAIIRSI
ncbi:MAG: HPr kinase/phosphatase C-terminal domain-containing protein [Sulfitobacter sp.]